MSVVVVVRVQARPDAVEAFAAELAEVLERIRREEPDCRAITAGRDGDEFVVHEVWEDRERFLRFVESRPFMQAYFARTRPLVVSSEMRVFEPFSEPA